MAHPQDHGFCSNGTVRLALVFVPCPSCPNCDCSKDFSLIPIGCGKHEPEMEKDIIALMSEELSLQKTVANETLQRSDALLTNARRVSSHYQKEAEKCTAGMETCEEARERAEAQLAESLGLQKYGRDELGNLGGMIGDYTHEYPFHLLFNIEMFGLHLPGCPYN